MKKFLVLLMVIAMTSFLFVGCLGDGVIPPVDDDDDGVDGVKTDTPYITDAGEVSILATTTEYIIAAGELQVSGVGVAGAIIKLYIDDVYAGIGYTSSGGAFENIGITGITLTEGAKKFHVTATLPGLAESDASTEYSFTYDKTSPTIVSVAGDSTNGYITVTFSDAVDADTVVDATWYYETGSTVPTFAIGTTHSPDAVTVLTSTTARLYFTFVDGDVFVGVSCSGTAIEDEAGNEMDLPVYIYGVVTD